MNKDLLIIGAGAYALVTKQIALSMGCFGTIGFLDDNASHAPDGTPVLGTCQDLTLWQERFPQVVVAIGNGQIRQRLLDRIAAETTMEIATLVSPHAFVCPSAHLSPGCIIEPMAVVHAGCELGKGCIISAGAVVNHLSTCGDCVHVNCNAVIHGGSSVPACHKVDSCTVYQTA
ncbi:MAG: hypothetical protein II320_03270 [Oscillospiraceae bacterium]|nr:hypothetical protein [Oscillospiraceae bacterium]